VFLFFCYYNFMRRLLTKETRALSRGDRPEHKRHSIFRRREGVVVKSAEGTRWAFATTPLPEFVGRVAATEVISRIAEDDQPGIIAAELIEDGHTAQLDIRQVGGKIIRFTVPTEPLVPLDVHLPEVE
jgi:hypothetical protein